MLKKIFYIHIQTSNDDSKKVDSISTSFNKAQNLTVFYELIKSLRIDFFLLFREVKMLSRRSRNGGF